MGIEDVIIVDTEDALLICSKDKAQNVKEVLKELKEKKVSIYKELKLYTDKMEFLSIFNLSMAVEVNLFK